MSATNSARHALPFLATAQAQKEITHNEALILIDALLNPVVQGVAEEPPELEESDEGKCWLVAPGAVGIWGANVDKMACWTGGSWRFLGLPSGAHILNISSQSEWRYSEVGWLPAPEILSPSGGTVVDLEAREVIELLLEHLRARGVVAGGV